MPRKENVDDLGKFWVNFFDEFHIFLISKNDFLLFQIHQLTLAQLIIFLCKILLSNTLLHDDSIFNFFLLLCDF